MLCARGVRTKEAWDLFAEGVERGEYPRRIPFATYRLVRGRLSLDFVTDNADRAILRHFVSDGADVILTSDDDILRHKLKLDELGIRVMRPAEWLNEFLKDARGTEDTVDWLERILFKVEK